MTIFEAILLAFVGGAVLNLMPCVLPVLALKISSLARTGGESSRARMEHGLGYSLGIMASMLVLAASVIALKSAGQLVGWGFQFQHPLFVAALTAVMVLFALNLFGVYEFTIPQAISGLAPSESSGTRRSFFEGVLAVVLATPCTAPFMGAAIGFAMAGDAWLVVAVFMSLGAGLASPFVLVAFVPAFHRFLPKPGNWMVVMKKLLGFALLTTALWLVWLFGRLTDMNGVVHLLGSLIAIAFAVWVYGELQYQSLTWKRTGVLTAVLLSVGLGTIYGLSDLQSDARDVSVNVAKASAVEPSANPKIDWIPWSESRVQHALEEGRPVFVNFTADWCISCKVNERTALSTPEVVAEVARTKTLMLQADLTRPEDELVAKLAEFGRSGVPLYLVYSPKNLQKPRILPQVLTRDMVVEAFAQAALSP
ncbi:MAG: thioredoxin family protein [Bradymonadaceae bacterium]|nr:thioredoxin family protein [Lujinxingiaceae bacterium]